jgi:hypothetical protein
MRREPPGKRGVLTSAKPAKRLPAVANVKAENYDGRWPGRRIGHRGDATRAPSQGPRPKEGGTKPPCIPFRDQYQCDKSLRLDLFLNHSLAPEAQSSISG